MITSHARGTIEREFTWTGLARQHSDTAPAIEVSGEFEEESEKKETRGRFQLNTLLTRPFISVTLNVNPDFYRELLLLLSASTARSCLMVALDLELTSEKWKSADFWDSGWLTQELDIYSFILDLGEKKIEKPRLLDWFSRK